MVVRHEKESAGATRRVDHGVGDSGLDDVDDRLDQSPRGEVLTSPGPLVRRTLGQQLLVRVALDVGAGLRSVLLVDQVDDEPAQLRRVLDAVLGLAEDGADDTVLAG